jgi:hypothetical protein
MGSNYSHSFRYEIATFSHLNIKKYANFLVKIAFTVF